MWGIRVPTIRYDPTYEMRPRIAMWSLTVSHEDCVALRRRVPRCYARPVRVALERADACASLGIVTIRWSRRAPTGADLLLAQIARTLEACWPLSPGTMSNSTRCPSSSDLKPGMSMAV